MVGRITVAAAITVLGLLLHDRVLRPIYSRLGATDAEVKATWPGDNLPAQNPGAVTRAITIHAPAHQIWPWIVQLGQDRGGFYSYTWLENLFGCRMRNADRIHPEFQALKVGDTVWMTPKDRYGGRGRMIVAMLIPNRAMILVMPDDYETVQRGGKAKDGSWGFILEPVAANTTRLIMRGAGARSDLLWRNTFDPAHFIMEHKMMKEIKRLSETNVSDPSPLQPLGY